MGSAPQDLSASRIGSALGLNKYESPIQLWLTMMGKEFCEKNGYEFPEFIDNEFTRMGLLFENHINNRLEKIYNVKIVGKERFFRKGILTCHIDGILNFKKQINNENKTTSSVAFRNLYGEEDTDQIPSYYIAQCQQHMYLTGKSIEYVHVLVFPDIQANIENSINENNLGNRDLSEITKSLASLGFLKRYIVERNDDLINKIKEIADLWINKYLKEKTPPNPKDYDDYRVYFRNPFGECVVTNELKAKINVYHRINAQNDIVKKYGNNIKKEIIDFMIKNKSPSKDENKCVLLDKNGFKLATWNGSKLYIRKQK